MTSRRTFLGLAGAALDLGIEGAGQHRLLLQRDAELGVGGEQFGIDLGGQTAGGLAIGVGNIISWIVAAILYAVVLVLLTRPLLSRWRSRTESRAVRNRIGV